MFAPMFVYKKHSVFSRALFANDALLQTGSVLVVDRSFSIVSQIAECRLAVKLFTNYVSCVNTSELERLLKQFGTNTTRALSLFALSSFCAGSRHAVAVGAYIWSTEMKWSLLVKVKLSARSMCERSRGVTTAGHNSPGAESLWRRWNVLTMSKVLY